VNDRARDQLLAAGFDLVHPFAPARLVGEPGLEEIAGAGHPLGWLVGNTRALWPRFVAARTADRELAAAEHPLELYTERTLAGIGARVWFGHRRYDGGFLPLQRLAVATGLGALAPIGLVIHPVYGPWFALRAVIVGDGPAVAHLPAASPCQCGEACLGALARAKAARGPEAWRAWLAVRDACPVGREHRYGDDQIDYHYTANRDRLG
jgi:methylmalonic aciduria homocystinuria type C protein